MEKNVIALGAKNDFFDIQRINEELTYFFNQHNLNSLPQINLTTQEEVDGASALMEGLGSFYNFNSGTFFDDEFRYNKLNSLLKGTETEKAFNFISYNLGMVVGRSRVMRLNGRSCYSLHRDVCKRVHLALHSSGESYLLFSNRGKNSDSVNNSQNCDLVNIPSDGRLYLTNTLKYHTALNTGLEQRTHIVFSVK